MIIAIHLPIFAHAVPGVAIRFGAIDMGAILGEMDAHPTGAAVSCAPVMVITIHWLRVALSGLLVTEPDVTVSRTAVTFSPLGVCAFANVAVACVNCAWIAVTTVNIWIDASTGVLITNIKGAWIGIGAICFRVDTHPIVTAINSA
jgi:hypothetical protein